MNKIVETANFLVPVVTSAIGICESGYILGMGVSDYRDMLFGLIATVPVIIAGRRAQVKLMNSHV